MYDFDVGLVFYRRIEIATKNSLQLLVIGHNANLPLS
jgi:hypothetical protein